MNMHHFEAKDSKGVGHGGRCPSYGGTIYTLQAC